MNGGSGPKRMLRIEEGQHYFLEPNDELPYKLLRNLGQGGFANVEEVEDRHTGMVLACKVFKFGGSSAERQRLFDNEVRVIRRLAPHHHITRIFATYTGRRQIGILLTPVADRGSLETILQDAHDGLLTGFELKTLHNSFGCLASGLRFMHAQRVRHKDIKPSNILVHGESVIYTDFGSSLDYSAATRSITTGRPTSMTRKYAAPELHEWSPRSSKTDIFSLGCVYLEILSALVLGPLDTNMTPYRDHIEDFFTLMQRKSSGCNTWLQVVINITCLMLNIEPEARPSAETITSQLWTCWPGTFCVQCTRSVSLQEQVVPPVYSAFTPAIAEDSWFTQNSPMSYDPRLQSSARSIFEANPIYDLLYQQQMVTQAEPPSMSGERYHIPPWAYPAQAVTPAYASSLQAGDVHPFSGRLIGTGPSSGAMDSLTDWSVFPTAAKASSDSIVSRSGLSRTKVDFQCFVCEEICKCNAEFRKHMLKHEKPFKCDLLECKRIEEFTTWNDLERHKKSVHGIEFRSAVYQCAVGDCRNNIRVWPRLDSFKCHIERMHKDEDMLDLVQRSKIC